MKCKRVKDLMSEYIDGEINESQRKDITIHLKSCASCKKIETSLRQTIIAPLKGAEKASVPEDIWHGLRSAITAGEEKNFVWVRPLGIPRPVLVPIA